MLPLCHFWAISEAIAPSVRQHATGFEGVEGDSVACKMTRRRLKRESVVEHLR